MKFLCLAYYDEKKFAALSPTEVEALVSQCPPHDQALRKTGRLLSVASLEATPSSKSLRPRAGRVVITDGPFAETKEQLGSFFLIEAKDVDEAVAIASLHPAARIGEDVGWGIEVRPIGACEPARA